jgi:hypothetical protein
MKIPEVGPVELIPHLSELYYCIVTCFFSARDNNNVDSSDLTRKFIGTVVEITRNSYNTQFRVSSNITIKTQLQILH